MKKFFAFLLVFVLAIAVSIPAFAASAPVPGNPSWDAKYKAAKTLEPSLGPAANIPNNPRDNASGDKIPSNAHSADVPGIYFYWDDKQKDSGVLLVLPEVFDMFVNAEFTLTAKNSNNYWGYTIKKDAAYLIDGVYAYGIPKQLQYISVDNKGKEKQEKEDLKNINMVFIDGQYKPAYFVIGKVFYNEVGRVYGTGDNNWDWRGMARESLELPGLYDLVSFNNGYVIGINKVEIKDYKSAWFGKTITVTENDIPGFLPAEKSISVTVKWDTLPTITFKNYKQWANIDINKVWLNECVCDECECVDCIEIDGIWYHVVAAPDDVKAEFTINGVTAMPGANQVKEGAYIVSELPVAGWNLISANDVEVSVAAGGSVSVTFFNCEIPIIPAKASVTLVKEWALDWVGDYANIPVVSFTELLGLERSVGNNGVFDYEGFEAGLEVAFSEVVGLGFVDEDDEYYYFWELDEVVVENGGDYLYSLYASPVGLELYDGDDYVLTFVNKIYRIKKNVDPLDINDKIPSKTHVDKWWEAFGVLAYGANSGNDKEIYYLGFSAEFWDVNESVTIAYGTSGKYDYVITITAVEVDGVLELVFTGDLEITVKEYTYVAVYFDNHYTLPKEKDHEFLISVGAYFGNVYESGARQIWLVSIQPK